MPESDDQLRAPHPGASSVSARLSYDPFVNYALQQNAVPVIREAWVENRGAEPIEHITLCLRAEPELADPVELHIERIGAEQAHHLDVLDLHLSPARLARQIEREEGELRVAVQRGEEVLYTSTLPLHVLAYSEWAGSQSIPEILAAFVLPNHPEIERLLGRARTHLASATGNPSLDGYQSRDPERARAIWAAIYRATMDLHLTYITPPASFETSGQKIRTPDRLLSTGMGTCLDLALLLVAAAEQAGLNPLVVLLDGHAFAGVWLHEESFVDATVDEVSRVSKRVGLDRIEVTEATGVATGTPLPYEEAVRAARAHLTSEERFAYAVDVRAARKHGIRPIPLRIAAGAYEPLKAPAGATEAMAPAPRHDTGHEERPVPETSEPASAGSAPESAPARVERWKRKLLDLSLRNRLLNYRPTKATTPLLCPDVARLEDFLADGSAFSLLPRPREADGGDPRDPALFRTQTGHDLLEDLLRQDLDQRRLRADLDKEELERRLVKIDRAARASLEEGGANTLYLAIGFLKWFESPSSQFERRAPLLLLPLEISRKSVLEEYRISLADDEPRFNVTLLQKLKADFGIETHAFDALETDESGLDVPGILRRMRELVLPMERWDVVEEAAIAHFSFTKHLMWLDLDKRAGELARNRVVRHLIETPNEPFASDGGDLPRPEDIDRRRSPTDTFCPKDADSSQLCAVHAAADGRTFVLWGPPGTGKSQTITNIIANALGHGKRVLFVSEKMAALNVVKSRLEAVGLGPFCLEIHSNKAQKAKVLEQLRQALEFRAAAAGADWERQGRKLQELTRKLDAHAEVIHRPRPLGLSAFQGLARAVKLAGAPEVRLDFGSSEDVDAAAFDDLKDHVEAMAAALREVGPPAASAWRASQLETWHPALADEVRKTVRALGEAAHAMRASAKSLEQHLGLGAGELGRQEIAALGSLCKLLADAPSVSRALIESAEFETTQGRAASWGGTLREITSLRDDLQPRWRESLFEQDVPALEARCRRARESFWPLSWLRGRRPRAELLPHAAGALPPMARIVEDLEKAARIRSRRSEIEAADARAREELGSLWQALDTDPAALEQALSFAADLRALAPRLAGPDLDRLQALRGTWARLVSEGHAWLQAGGSLAGPLATCAGSAEALEAALVRAKEVLALDEEAAWGTAGASGLLDVLHEQAERWQERLRDLRPWCTWRRLRREATDRGLDPLVEALESGTIQPSDLELAFERGFHAWWTKDVFAREPLLARFDGPQHQEVVRKFRNLDLLLTESAHAMVRGHVAADLPRGQHELSSSSSSEMGTLQRELAKRKRHKPIRKLFELIPNLLARLKPCMLMSPLSVAQYLTTDFPLFDMVVFDEASQIPVWDSIGAIARGEELVVVGDPKQLPPTSFFMRSDDEEPDEDEIEEMESILDECRGARLPELRLNWHYRSRHEGLIAFSNHHYYDNRLHTFPSALQSAPDLGVSLAYVENGVYDRGRSRANQAEARRIVAEVVARLQDPARCRYTIGIVTFSSAQQTLIEDLLDEARREHADIEPYFTSDVEEPVFVKNLENVQGDERDVILFSICYGPDANGNIALNFGPINRDGGERRLNVAVTRARRQIVVFSSLKGDQIDLARTKARGMRDLKHFLEYAERGAEVLGRELSVDPSAETESIFEDQVREALVAQGLDIVPQVGCSGYRIDLGVKDPDRPGRFLLGIECDGAMYHSAKTARDRDRLRQAVLESLGWTLHRIWSTDWWMDPERETERVLQVVEELRRPPSSTADKEAEDGDVASSRSELFASSAHMSVAAAPPPPPPTTEADIAGAVPYGATPPLRTSAGPDRFYDPSWTRRLRDMAARVLDAEAPIQLRLLSRRVAEAFDLHRATDRVLDRMREVLAPLGLRMTSSEGTEFVWRPDQDPHAYSAIRVPGPEDRDRRKVDELPPEEIANAAAAVLRDQVSMDADDLARESARVLGFHRVGQHVRACMEAGLDVLVHRGHVRRSGDQLVWMG